VFLIGADTERDRATRIGVARICVGSLLLITTGFARRLFGVPADQDNQALRMMARLTGIRNIFLGAWALAAQDHGDDQRRLCYQLNAATDATDLGILVIGGLKEKGLRRTAAMSCALGGSALLAWLDLLQDVGSRGGDAPAQ
jgi:hypothetical protein